jgi:hypothetical protein
MVVLVGVLVVLFIVAFLLLSESAPAQRWRSRHGGWYPGAYGSGCDFGSGGGGSGG